MKVGRMMPEVTKAAFVITRDRTNPPGPYGPERTNDEAVTMDRDEVQALILEVLRTDPEVQGAVLALLAGALGMAQAAPEAALGMPSGGPGPHQRQRPDWVLRQLQAQEQES